MTVEVMTMMWGDGWDGWIGGTVMMLMMLVVWGGPIALVVFLARGFGARTYQGEHQRREPDRREPDAREILAERFARGEISEDEFEQRKRVLERAPS